MPVYLIRHTEKEEDRKAFPVDTETPLSAVGVAHAPIVGKHLAEDIVRRGGRNLTVKHSTARRVVQHVELMVPVLEQHGIAVTLEPDKYLIDKNHGSIYALNERERAALSSEAWRKFKLTKDHHPNGKLVATPPDGESWYDLLRRVRPTCKRLCAEHTPQDYVAIVAHSGSLCAAETPLLHLSELSFSKLPIPNFGSVRVLEGASWDELRDSGYIYAGHPKKASAPQTQGEVFNTQKPQGGQLR